MRNSTLPRSAIFLVCCFLSASVLVPLPYAVLQPGGGTDVLKSMISIPSQRTFPANGKLLLTTVYATSPTSRIFGGDILRSWIDGEAIVLPREALYPSAKSTKQIDAENTAQMLDSQEAAKISALTYLGFTVAHRKVKNSAGKLVLKYTLPFAISIDLKKTGGPSGGLVFALGIVAKLTTEDFLKGRSVAGTGTIDVNGHVGAIGGIGDKMIAARRAGASLFLAPSDNCDDIVRIPAGLRVFSVATLEEAVSVLRDSHNSVPHCTWQWIG
jgi:PDZ domain-containing protein